VKYILLNGHNYHQENFIAGFLIASSDHLLELIPLNIVAAGVVGLDKINIAIIY
jgi:hypothetical protein